MEFKTYRKIPVNVEAVQIVDTDEGRSAVAQFLGTQFHGFSDHPLKISTIIEAPTGVTTVLEGDWILKVNDAAFGYVFKVVSKEEFAKTYEEVI